MGILESEYELAWVLYVLAALACMGAFWYFTGWLWRWLKEPLRLVVAVLLFTPTLMNDATNEYAPAVAVVALELFFQTGVQLVKAISDFELTGLFALIAYGIFVLLRWFWERSRAKEPQDNRTLREHLAGESPANIRHEPRI